MLVQYLDGKHDGWAPETWKDSEGHTRQGAYTAPWPKNVAAPTPPEGIASPIEAGSYASKGVDSYIDAPAKKAPKKMISEIDAYQPRKYKVDVKAYCRCRKKDTFWAATSFTFERRADGSSFIERTGTNEQNKYGEIYWEIKIDPPKEAK